MFTGGDQPVSSGFRWCLKNVPLANRLLRLYIYSKIEVFGETVQLTKKGAEIREEWEAISKKYIVSAAPEKYRSILVPDYHLGCKVCLWLLNERICSENIPPLSETNL